MTDHILTGFGFGPIQAGLFVPEAYASGNFSRIVIAEVDSDLVNAIRENNGCYKVNIAGAEGIYQKSIDNVEIYNPLDQSQRDHLSKALSLSNEIVTSLPSVDYYEMGGQTSVVSLLSKNLTFSGRHAAVIYTAENNNHAAEILSESVRKSNPGLDTSRIRFLNTVIGKMSRTVTDKDEIRSLNLQTIAPGFDRAFLVEQFNKILVTRSQIQNFKPGIEVFVEKDDLLPFEEAKLYGHNAIHALIAYLAAGKNFKMMTDVKNDTGIMKTARNAFIDECGAALINKYNDLNDELFTKSGFSGYADDLLSRMVNPWLNDTVERAARDPLRKLGFNDRIFGTVRLALKNGIEPVNMALGALAGIRYILNNKEKYNCPVDIPYEEKISPENLETILKWLWSGSVCDDLYTVKNLLVEAGNR